MAKVTLNLLSEEEKTRVHTASLQLLEEVGLQILDAEAVDILSGAGAAVDRASKRVRFPADLVEEAVHHAPSEIDLCGRDPSQSVHLAPGAVFYTTNGYATNIYDPSSGRRHEIRQEDLAYITQLADSLDQVDIYSVLATPCDTPPGDKRSLPTGDLPGQHHETHLEHGLRTGRRPRRRRNGGGGPGQSGGAAPIPAHYAGPDNPQPVDAR